MKMRRAVNMDDVWQLCQGSGRHVTIKIDDPLLSYQNVYFYGSNGENYRPVKLKTFYGFVTRRTPDEIEFDALTAAEYRQHAARSAEGLHPLRFTV